MAVVLLGQTGTGVLGADSNTAGAAFCQRLQCLATGIVTTAYLRCGATGPTAGNLRVAIYSEVAGPNAGVMLTPEVPGNFVANAFAPINIPPVTLFAGTFYWVAWLGIGATTNYTNFAASGGTNHDSTPTTLTNLPGTYGNGSAFTNIQNVYVEGNPLTIVPRGRPLGL